MNKVCLICERTSPDSNLFCQEAYCPAEMSPYIMGFGEWLGDIEIIRPMSILRSSTLYEARHNNHHVLLKVAHPGQEHTERLKREAMFLRDVLTDAKRDPSLPTLLAPYANTTPAKDPYGRAMLKEHLLYFCLFKAFEGEPLRDVLIKNPQLWIFHVGWIVLNLATSVAFLESKGLYHYTLSPDSLLVRFSSDTPSLDILLFDLGVVSDRKQLGQDWHPTLAAPAYTAPELVNTTATPNYATDVYGLGVVLYELLVGTPAFPYKLHSDGEIYQAVLQQQRVRMNRVEDVKDVAALASTAVSAEPAARQKSAADVAEALLKIFGRAPALKKRRLPTTRTALLATVMLLAIAFLITFGVSITSVAR